jgi:hypothetical protein
MKAKRSKYTAMILAGVFLIPLIPAQAGIQLLFLNRLGPRFRGDERIIEFIETTRACA